MHSASTEARPACPPRVFVYDLPELWDLDMPLNDSSAWRGRRESIYGPRCSDGGLTLFDTDRTAMPAILLYRLLHPRARCGRVDASQADLYVIPFYPKPGKPSKWRHVCRKPQLPLSRLEHLNTKTAARHVILIGEDHAKLDSNGPGCNWLSNPPGLLAEAIRIFPSQVLYTPYPVTVQKDGSQIEKWYGPVNMSETLLQARASAARVRVVRLRPPAEHFSTHQPSVGMTIFVSARLTVTGPPLRPRRRWN